jgi:hypothetical protein
MLCRLFAARLGTVLQLVFQARVGDFPNVLIQAPGREVAPYHI